MSVESSLFLALLSSKLINESLQSFQLPFFYQKLYKMSVINMFSKLSIISSDYNFTQQNKRSQINQS